MYLSEKGKWQICDQEEQKEAPHFAPITKLTYQLCMSLLYLTNFSIPNF